jgi:hypothetical protein
MTITAKFAPGIHDKFADVCKIVHKIFRARQLLLEARINEKADSKKEPAETGS